MYTVLWQENGMDKWDRFETKEEVDYLLEQLKENPNVCEYDIWIFNPEADDNAYTYEDFIERNDN